MKKAKTGTPKDTPPKLIVGAVERYDDVDSGATRLRVPFEIVCGEETVLTRNESFPLDTTQEEIVATLKRHLEVFTTERAREAESKERKAQLDAADEVAGEISNITIE